MSDKAEEAMNIYRQFMAELKDIKPEVTLRDYFAVAAMHGFLTARAVTSFEEFAVASYSIADAMLKEREK
ncbi:MAG: hypothetical protein PHQ35_11095 [Phycisphaerae bacterium]|nr:hypothetical protein [Phycisphaerae bacterium]